MHEQVIAHPHVVDIARRAMVDCDIEPQMKPIRGGTDGAQLSFMGLPCPNLFTGGYNYHGKHEFVTPGRNGESGVGDRAYRRADGGTQRALILLRRPGKAACRTRCRMAASPYPAYGPAGERGTRRPGKRGAAGQDDGSVAKEPIAAVDQRCQHGEERRIFQRIAKWSARSVRWWLRRPAPDGAGSRSSRR